MKTLIPALGALNLSIASAASRLFIAGSVLAVTACSGAGMEETALAANPDGAVHDEDVGVPAADPEGIATLQEPLFNACSNVDIRVSNDLSYDITVRSLEYYNYTESRWQTEDLTNHVVSPGTMWFWTPTFENTDGDTITSFNVTYDHPGHNGHVYHVNTPDQACATGRVYLLEIQ